MVDVALARDAQGSSDTDAVIAEEFDRLRGQILGLIESWGLPTRQEQGCKATFKTLTYDAQKRVSESVA